MQATRSYLFVMISRNGAFRRAQSRETAISTCRNLPGRVIAPCGKTNYEFYSVSRRKPVHNNISWFVMETSDEVCEADPETGTIACRFEEVSKALDEITYSQDKSLLMMAYQKFRESTKD